MNKYVMKVNISKVKSSIIYDSNTIADTIMMVYLTIFKTPIYKLGNKTI